MKSLKQVIRQVKWPEGSDGTGDDGAEAIVNAIRLYLKEGLPVLNVKDGYSYFEKYTDCEHKTRNELGNDCQACDTTWLIARCKCLEKALKDIVSKI